MMKRILSGLLSAIFILTLFPSSVLLAAAPTVTTGEILDLTATGALVLGEITDSGLLEILEKGVVFATTANPTTADNKAVSSSLTPAFSAALTGLSPNTAYYARAYAINADGTAYGETRLFMTPVRISTLPVGSLPQAIGINLTTNKIYIANNIGNSISVINGDNDTVLKTISVGRSPYNVAINEITNKIYVANNMENYVSVINGNTDTVDVTITAGVAARAVAVNQTTNTIYVTNYTTANVSVINGDTNTLTATVAVGSRPIAVAIDETANKIYVANYWGNSVTVIDGATNSTSTISVGNYPRALAVNQTTHKIYVVNYRGASVTVINGPDNSAETVTVGSYPWEAAVNQITNKVYVTNSGTNNVTIIDGATNTIETINAGRAPEAVAINEITNRIYVGNYSSDSRSGTGYIVTCMDGDTHNIVGLGTASNPGYLAVNKLNNKTYILNSNNVTIIEEFADRTVVAGTAADRTAIMKINNKDLSLDNQWRINVTSGTLRGTTGADLTTDITLNGLPAGLTYNATNGGNNVIVITLSGAATTALAADAAVSLTIRGSAITAAYAQDSESIALDLWYIGAGTTFVLSNESGGLIDDLITAGYGNSNLYQTLVSLAPASGGVITERFLETLANCQAGSEIFTVKLSNFAGLNNPVVVNIDGTLGIRPIFGRDYFGETGYATYPNTPVYEERFTYATSELYYIDAGARILETSRYLAFAIAWTVDTELNLNQTAAPKPVGAQQTVTATCRLEGVLTQGVRIDFLITDGPNAGKSGSSLTDVNGQARFTYAGDHGAGRDTILVTAYDQNGSPLDSAQTTREWSGAPIGVGGEVAPVNRLDLLTPWMFLFLALLEGGFIFALRRHKTSRKD